MQIVDLQSKGNVIKFAIAVAREGQHRGVQQDGKSGLGPVA